MQSHSEQEKFLLDSWERNRIFERSVEDRPADRQFTFYDGPPFATGLPHYGHLLASIIKDVVPRFWTMRGFRVERRWGWDCHGVPIENMIEKELDLKGGKKGIEEMGIGSFNAACRSAILRFDKEWEGTIRRIGRWVDFKNSYKTMDSSFMESVWWAFKTLYDKKIAYQGRRVILYCPRCATPLSNFEIAMDNSYKDVEDNSVYVKFQRKDAKNEYFLAWTTTPWTLPGNVGLAVDREAEYVKVQVGNEFLWMAKSCMARTLLNKGESEGVVVETVLGSSLLGLEYEPLYSFMSTDGKKAHYILPASFVSLEDGSGIVHTAAVFGEDDYKLAQEFDLPCVPTLDDEGKFLPVVTPLAGVFYKKGEQWVIDDLSRRNLVWSAEKFVHSYPMCYRCSTPLYYNAVPAWFIDVQSLKPKLLEQNENINWYPEHLKHGRFGKGLETAPDWNISRSRYWGTPMPVWEAADGTRRVLGTFGDLKTWAVDSSQVEGLTDFHREFIDDIELWVDDEKTKKGKRIPEVFDCWMESGSMPFASVHAPFENQEAFKTSFPGGFVTEYIAQTRAWFYVMHVLSVALFDSNAVQNILTTGTVLAADGTKMSKSKKNYPDPSIVLEKYGADAVRYYLMSNPIVNGENLNFSEAGVDEVGKKFINILKNVVAFYGLYKEHDDGRMPSNAHVLDQWITARLTETLKIETEAMERYDLADASRTLQHFVTDLSTWYVRRSRDRVKNDGEDRAEALATLRSTLVTFAKMTAPFMPFLAEMVYRDVTGADESDSVHLQAWPETRPLPLNKGESEGVDILSSMGEARAIVSRVMEVRDNAGRAVKQALGSVKITTPSGIIDEGILAVILDEVNVKSATVVKGADLNVEVDTNLTPELIREGIAREVTRRVNGMRKENGLTIADRVALTIDSESDEVKKMFAEHSETIKADTLSSSIDFGAVAENAIQTSFRVAEQDIIVGFVGE
ncbi:MAG: isoleucine--tRNA ligase [Patescibacteria group bacterium]|jgi:isoleucyl-tRNA synthetase